MRRITRDSYAQLERIVADWTRDLATLNAVATVAGGSLEIERILEDSLDQTLATMHLDCGGAFRLDEGASSMALVAQRSLPKEEADALREVPLLSWGARPVNEELEPRVMGEALCRPVPSGPVSRGNGYAASLSYRWSRRAGSSAS